MMMDEIQGIGLDASNDEKEEIRETRPDHFQFLSSYQ
jgi:hypothetical protein